LQDVKLVAHRSSLINIGTFLILYKVGLHSGGASLSGWSLPHTYTHTHIQTHTCTHTYRHTDTHTHTHRICIHIGALVIQ